MSKKISELPLYSGPNNPDGLIPMTILGVTYGVQPIKLGTGGSTTGLPYSILDGVAGTTAGFTSGQTTFTLPTGSICRSVRINDAVYSPTTANNTSRNTRWSQMGTTVTIYKALALNNYICIEYL